MIDIPIGLFAIRESHMAADHGMRLSDGVDFDGHDTGALGSFGGDGSLRRSDFGGGLFQLLGLFLLDQRKIEVVHQETDVHVGHRDLELRRKPLLDLRKRGAFGYPGGNLGNLFGGQSGHSRLRCGTLR